MRFQKYKFCEKCDFINVNFVKIEISEVWILWKMSFLKLWILWKLRFQTCEFCENWGFRKVNQLFVYKKDSNVSCLFTFTRLDSFAPVCDPLHWRIWDSQADPSANASNDHSRVVVSVIPIWSIFDLIAYRKESAEYHHHHHLYLFLEETLCAKKNNSC